MIKEFLRIEINTKRIYGLDILRALAILFVLVGHGIYLLPEKLIYVHRLIVFDGVSIFFVLSGFLIGGILIKIVENKQANKKTLFDFWKRRWFRTLPNYFLILLIITFYFVISRNDFQLLSVKKYFIFCQNLLSPHPGFFPEAWSLSVEEWFYLLIPTILFILIAFFKIKPKNSILISAFSILLFVVLFRTQRYLSADIASIGDWDSMFRKQVFTRLDSLMFGVLGAYIQYYYPQKWIKVKLPLLLLGIILFAITKYLKLFSVVAVDSFYMCVLSFSVTSLATLFLLPFLSNLKTGSGVLYRGITMISLISYSMYLLNLTIVQNIIIKEIIPWDYLSGMKYLTEIFQYTAYWIFTIVGSIIIYKYYEIPLTRLRDKKWSKIRLPTMYKR
jgi:peptidoglycan/LPS O-acetylase OafA/YrhL